MRYHGKFYFLFFLLFYGASTSFAQVPDAPVILDFTAGGCVPEPEICGDGVDQDCDGSDQECGGGGGGQDADFDGYAADVDCDDNDREVYPGISVACAAQGCTSGYKTCQGSGSFTACSCSALCEATGSGRCFYVSKLTGSDSNPGSFNQPFRTLAPVRQYYCGSSPTCADGDVAPPNTVSLRAGDVVYLLSGSYTQTYNFGGIRSLMYIHRLNGTSANPITIKAYPGAHPVFAPQDQARGFYIIDSSHLLIEGIEVSGAYQHGIQIADSSNLELRNLWVHHTDGIDNNNLAGIRTNDVVDWSLHHSQLNDNYDRTNSDTGGLKTDNSRNMVLFDGGNFRFHHNVVFSNASDFCK